MNKLEQLEKALKQYRDLLEKQMSTPISVDGSAANVNTASVFKAEDKKKKKHDDEKEDKRLIAEALDEHNEEKHGETKDEDSAFKKMGLKKSEQKEMIKFDTNGQWSLEKLHNNLI